MKGSRIFMQQVSQTATTIQIPGAERPGDRLVAIGIISAHTIEHVYARGMLVILTEMQVVLGLPVFQTFLLDGVRSLAGGLTSMCSGLFVDMFQHRIGQILGVAMVLMGVGYLILGLAPTFTVIVVALIIAGAGSALWHPPALALLSYSYPDRRGLLTSLHRSTGNLGEVLGPVVVGGLLLALTWRWVVSAGVPLVFLIAVLLFVFLWNVGGPKPEIRRSFSASFQLKWPALKRAMTGRGMLLLLAVSAIRGLGDRALLLGIPLYLRDEVGLGGGWVAFHVALFTAAAIMSGPIIGGVSDRIGRKPMILMVMALSTIFPLAMVAGGGEAGSGEIGILFTASVAMYGLFLFSVNSLTQAAALDLAEGQGLEGSVIGMMWGIGTLFGFGASLSAGALAGWNWNSVFYFGAVSFAVGFLVSLMLPTTGRRQPAYA